MPPWQEIARFGAVGQWHQLLSKGGHHVKVPFTPVAEQTVDSFAPLEQTADGFRNYLRGKQRLSAEELLVDRAGIVTFSRKATH